MDEDEVISAADRAAETPGLASFLNIENEIGRVVAWFFDVCEKEYTDFIEKYCVEFTGIEGDEHKLIYTDIYNEFKDTFEDKLTQRIEQEGMSVDEFYALAKEMEGDNREGNRETLFWLQMLISSFDFEAFVETMRDERQLRVEQGLL